MVRKSSGNVALQTTSPQEKTSTKTGAECRHGCLHGARSTPIHIGVPNGDRAAEPADAQGANLIGQWISIIERTPSSGAKISRRDHDFVIKKSRHEVA